MYDPLTYQLNALGKDILPSSEKSILAPFEHKNSVKKRPLFLLPSQRLHAYRHTTGYGHIYQPRFKIFPIEEDQSLLKGLRYVKRNALRANLVEQAQNWHWRSLWRKLNGDREAGKLDRLGERYSDRG